MTFELFLVLYTSLVTVLWAAFFYNVKVAGDNASSFLGISAMLSLSGLGGLVVVYILWNIFLFITGGL